MYRCVSLSILGSWSKATAQDTLCRVGVYIAAQVAQIVVVVNVTAVIWPFKECAAVVVAFVKGFTIAVEDKLWQLAGRLIAILPHQEVIMIWHQAVGNDGEVELAQVLFHQAQDIQVVFRFAEDRFAVRPTIVDMIVMTGKEVRQFAAHIVLLG